MKRETSLSSDETSLIEAARFNPDAFAILYHRYLTPIYRYLLSRVNGKPEAEDLVAQVFIDALEGLVAGRYHEGGCFSAWLFTIAHRRLVDFYRQNNVQSLGEIPSLESSLASSIEKKENIQRLKTLLNRLDDRQQELLRLRFSAGLGFKEISLLDGRSEAAVKMAFYRTLDFLRDHWEDPDE